MSKGVNKVILIGNLGKDPDNKFMPNGSAFSVISLATSESWKDKQTGEQHERTEWHRVVFYNRLAEIAGEYLRKGSKIYIEGRMRTTGWEKDGEKRYATEIIGDNMQMLDGKNSQPEMMQNIFPKKPSENTNTDFNGDIPFDDDIPF